MSVIVRKPQNKRKPWVVRYQANGKQREESFSTKAEATARKTDIDYGQRYGTHVDPKQGKGNFGEAAETYINRMAVNERSKESYRATYRKHIRPVFGGMTLANVANDRDGVADLLTVTMAHLSISPRRQARMIILGTLDEAVLSGKITAHRLTGIDLGHARRTAKHKDFQPASEQQIDALADAAGIWVHVMHGTGARPEEAIGADKADFIAIVKNGKIQKFFRISGQATRDGRAKVLCKKRYDEDDVRLVPCPRWLWDKVIACPDGPLMPGTGDRLYAPYESVRQRFNTARNKAGLPATYTPHSVRHQWGSRLLRANVPVGDVAGFLGHKDIRTTYMEYRSELDGAAVDTLAVLEGLRAA